MRWAIPEFRLPGSILEKEIRFLSATGISFEGNRTLGKNLDLARLEKESHAVLLGMGAHGRAQLNVMGEEGASVFPVLQFLKALRERKRLKIGERVVVIGGGNAAVDAVQAALRLGAKKVTLVYLESGEEMPAFSWEIADAEEEGVTIQNGWGPQQFRRDGNKLVGVSFKKSTAVCDAEGCFCPALDERTVMDLPADTVIVAIGQKPEMSLVDPALQENGAISNNLVTLQTAKPNIFVAGVLLRPRTLVEAMAEGKEAALSIQRLLQGEDLGYERGSGKPLELQFEPDWSRAKVRPRVAMSTLPVAQRRGFAEVAKGYSGEEAQAEAERGLDRGVPFGLRTCWFCLPCEIECPEEALYVEIPYLLRQKSYTVPVAGKTKNILKEDKRW